MKKIVTKLIACMLLCAFALSLSACRDVSYEYEDGRVYADVIVKDFGTIVIELYFDVAPISCANFVDLANRGVYEDSSFHRILSDFMIQGGMPADDSLDLTPIVGEFSANGYENNLSHKRGVVSMARTSVNDSATSQFFICNADYPSLNGQYAAFGRVVSGMDVVDAITEYGMKHTSYQLNGMIYDESKRPVIDNIVIHDLRADA